MLYLDMVNPSLFKILLFTIRYLPRYFLGRIKDCIFYWIPQKMLWIDLGLCWQYLFLSPQQISRRFIKDNQADQNVLFGDTPLAVLDKLFRHAKIPEEMVIFDVGCGWGRSTFFLHALTKAHRTIGIDIIPTYIQRAERIRQWLKLDYIVFIHADLRKVDYSDANVIYMYGTCFKQDLLADIVAVWEQQLLDGTIVISTSYSLEPYSKQDRIHVQDIISAHYMWGACLVYIHIIETDRSQ